MRPNYPNAFNKRGAAYMASGGDRKQAIADFDQAIKLKPDFRYAYVNRATAELWNNWRQGLADFHRAGIHPERAGGPFRTSDNRVSTCPTTRPSQDDG